MRRALVLSVVGAIFWTVALCHAQTTQGTGGVVAGKVVDAEGKGVEQVTVNVFPGGKDSKALAAVTTGDDGVFRFNSIPAGDGYRLEAVKTGGLFTKRATKTGVKVVAGQGLDVGPMELKVGARKSAPATGPSSAEGSRGDAAYLSGDVAWDRYTVAAVQFQRDMAGLIVKQRPDLARAAEVKRDLQLARRELGAMRMRYVLKNDPGRLDRAHGISQFVNLSWSDEDTAKLEKADPTSAELKKRIDELKRNSGVSDEAKEFVAKLQGSDEFKALRARMVAEMAEAEKVLERTGEQVTHEGT